MKRLLSLFVITLIAAVAVQAQQVTELAARQTAERFVAATSSRFSATTGSSALRLAYTADKGRFYIFNRGENGGYVIVAGDERLPQVLGYGRTGSFMPGEIPLAMQDWMNEMNREIAYLQSNRDIPVHQPVKRAAPVEPMMTTQWDQDEPYNNLCPTYNGGAARAVTGCVATAMTQIMNYHRWPIQGTGSHSYRCNVNETDPTTLSADFSQSVYEWDLMLDSYDVNSSEESCYAVAKLMVDAGISIDMNYGSSSGAQETAVLTALTKYFGYSDKHYLLQRDLFGAEEWDQILMDEISAGRPILYCGYAYSQGSLGGHAFVFDGFDGNGYFHVNWGWGGAYDNYFLVSLLAPSSGNNFKFGQDAIFGIIPAPKADEVAEVLYVRGLMHPDMVSVPRGNDVIMEISDMYVCGNMLDTVGVESMGYWSAPYDIIPMELRVLDADGVVRQSLQFSYKAMLDGWWAGTPNVNFIPDASLADGEYTIRLIYSSQKDENFDTWVCDDYGQPVSSKMTLSDDMVYLSDGFLAAKYDLESMGVGRSIFVNEPFDVNVTLSYNGRFGPQGTPAPTSGNVHLSLLANGQEVATSEPVPVSVAYNTTQTFTLQMMAPAQWGRYQLKVVDESGRAFTPQSGWYDLEESDGSINIVIVPKSEELVEDFESMKANSKTNETNVQGVFTSWNFNKSGVRAPGEGKCNGTNSVMMKKPSTFYSIVPVYHNIMMAAATFFNNSTTDAKYTLEYSTDNGATWVKASTIEGDQAAMVPATSVTQVIWPLNLKTSDASLFRVSMTGGGSASTYVDDFILRYNDALVIGDVNLDGEVNIADVNAVIDMILGAEAGTGADVNGDGEVNVADVNAVISLLLN